MKSKRMAFWGGIICFALIWLVRYITLNGGFRVNTEYERSVYEKGDVVSFDDNMSSGIQYYKDYSISIDDCKIYDSAEYIEKLGKTEEDFELLIPEKVVELTATLYNNGDKEDGIYFSSLQLVGTDWYEYTNSEFTAYANEIFEDDVYSAYGIIVEPQSSYTVKIIYNLPRRGRTLKVWENIEKENMYLEITLRPINKIIKLG